MTKLSKSEAGRLGNKASRAKQVSLHQQRIALYESSPHRCLQCQDAIEYLKRQNKFCSKSCAATHNNIKVPKRKCHADNVRQCKQCNKDILNSRTFCSISCYGEFYRKYDPETKPAIVKAKNRSTRAKYRAKLLAQTPPDADLKAINEFYINCPPGHEVDHIIPISKGGLHTLENLQYLTISENRSKGAKLDWVKKT